MNGLSKESSKAVLTIMAKYNPNLIKIHRSYTYEELAGVFGIHKNTVASWVKNGLPCLQEQRPFLILGSDAKAFLHAQRANRKHKCKPNEFYCVRCKVPVKVAENFVEYIPLSPTKGCLTGFCSRCESVVNKFIGYSSLATYSPIFEITKPTALEHIKDTDNPLLNSDLSQ